MKEQTDKTEGLKIVRHFNVPMQDVFDAFASKAAMAEWWGPVGMSLTVKSFDFSPGGVFHYHMQANENTMWGLFKYVSIIPPNFIEFISSFSDEHGNVCKSPFPMDFPLEILNQITLTEHKGTTTLTLQGHPINATEVQEATYHAIKANMQEGFGATFNQLEKYLQSHVV